MTTVTVYRSTDASAPVLTGSVGTLITVLNAVLVNGYGSQSGAGWTQAFTGTNKVAYRNSAVDGTGFYLSIDDSGPGGGGAKEARMTGFETLSAVATGTGQFPTAGQLNIGSGAVVCRKSATADSTARAWTIIADDTVFYLFTETGDNVNPTLPYTFMFGDIFSYKANDAYRCLIVGRSSENLTNGSGECLPLLDTAATLLATNSNFHYMPRSWTGVGGSVPVWKHTDYVKSNAFTFMGSAASPTFFPYPNGPDGGLHVAPVWIHHNNAVRGYLKGIWCPMHAVPLNHNDTYSGTGNLNGKSFLAQNVTNGSPGQVHIETSSTWS